MATQVGNVIFSISADLKSLQGQLRTMEGNFNTSFGRIESLAQSFGKGILSGIVGGLSVGALVAFGKSVVDRGDELSDLADQTGNTIAVLGGIKPVLEQNNSSLESFAKGMSRVQKSLGDVEGDGKQAAEGFKALNLNVEDLRKLSPDEFIEAFSKALAEVPDRNNRAAAANKILGRSFAELTPAILALAKDGVQKLDEDTAKAYETLGRLKDQTVKLAAELANASAGPLADTLVALETVVRSVVGSIADLNIGIERSNESWLSYRRFTEFATAATLSFYAAGLKVLKIAPQLAEALTLNSVDFNSKGFTDAIRGVESEIARLEGASDARRALAGAGAGGVAGILPRRSPANLFPDTAAQKKAAEELKRIMEAAAKSFADSLEEQDKAATAAGKDMIEVFKALKKEGFTPVESAVADINARFDELIAKAVNAGAATGQSMKPFIDQLEFFRRQALLLAETPTTGADLFDADMGQQLRDAQKEFRDLALAAQEYGKAMGLIDAQSAVFGSSFDALSAKIAATREEINRLLKGGESPLGDEIQKLKRDLDELSSNKDIKDGLLSVFDGLQKGISTTLQGVMLGTQSFADGMKNIFANMALGIVDVLTKALIINPLKNALNNWINEIQNSIGSAGGGGGGFGGIIGGLFGSLFGGVFGGGASAGLNGVGAGLGADFVFAPGRASGGPVNAGQLYRVNERGMEFFKPSTGGAVIPLGGMASGGGGGGQTIYNIDARHAQKGVSEEILKALMKHENRAVTRAVGAVKEERVRSNSYAKTFR